MTKKIAFIISVILIISLFSACGINSGAQHVGYSFVDAITSKNYEQAYDLCYKGSEGIGEKEDFVKRYNNIYSALEITDMSCTDRSITQRDDNGCFNLTYKINFTSTLLGEFSYDYQAMIIPDISGYSIMFDPSLILPYMELGDTVRVTSPEGKRGEIFTEDKEPVAINTYADSIYIIIEEIPEINSSAIALSSLIDMPAEDIIAEYDKAVKNGYDTAKIKDFGLYELSEEAKVMITDMQGVYINSDSMTPLRYYPYMDTYAHIVGYSGYATAEDIERSPELSETDVIGKTGLEKEYNDMLMGENGKKIFVQDSAGHETYVIYESPAQSGADIMLTIDSDLQNKAYTLLASNLKEGQSGVAIVMDYNTGAVKASAQYPSFDANWFTGGISSEKWEYLTSEEANNPLYDKVTQAVYPPGSTLKVFTCVPALEADLIELETVVDLDINDNKWIPDPSIADIGNKWVYPAIVRSEETLGALNLLNSIKSSDNIFFSYLALITGADEFKEYMERIGLGEAVSYELPVARSTFVKEGSELNLHLLATSGYGMGEIQMTPLQLASMYTAFMNDGDILNPHIIKNISKEENGDYKTVYETQTTCFKENIMTQKSIDEMKTAMRIVMDAGTGYPIGLHDLDIIGKTGTATLVAKGENSREVNWVVAICRDEGNEKLVLVMVDSKADEGDNKFDIARGLLMPEDYEYYGSYDEEDEE